MCGVVTASCGDSGDIMNTLSTYIAGFLPQDFKAALLAKCVAEGINTRAWQPGQPERTLIATHAQALATGFGLTTTQQAIEVGATNDGYMSMFAHGGLLQFAANISLDPSVQSPDGSYPAIGGFLDSIADGIYNIQRTGGPNGGPGVESNSALTLRCISKVIPIGTTLATLGVDPFVYYATTGYAGVALSAPITRTWISYDKGSNGWISLLLAGAGGAPAAVDLQAMHDFLQTYVSWGASLVVMPADVMLIDISADIYVPASYAAQAAIDLPIAWANYCDSIPIGGLPIDATRFGIAIAHLRAAFLIYLPYLVDVENLTLSGGAVDYEIDPTAVPVVNVITFTVHAT